MPRNRVRKAADSFCGLGAVTPMAARAMPRAMIGQAIANACEPLGILDHNKLEPERGQDCPKRYLPQALRGPWRQDASCIASAAIRMRRMSREGCLGIIANLTKRWRW
jgi:hypothetical protein